MKFVGCILCAVVTMCAASCGSGHGTDKDVQVKNTDFEVVMEVEDSVVELPGTLHIKEWRMVGGKLLCFASGNDQSFHVFDGDNFEKTDSFGVIGNGPGEFVMPSLVRGKSLEEVIYDPAQLAIFKLDRDLKPIALETSGLWGTYNFPVSVSNGIIGFTDKRKKDKVWLIKNISTGETMDSLFFLQKDMKNSKVPVDFKVASNANRFVVARQFADECVIGNINDDSKIESFRYYEGVGKQHIERPYYVDVDCGDKEFYLLSMKNVDFSDRNSPKGICEVEVYNYDGNPLRLIKLDFMPRKMLLDEKRNRLLFMSAMDDNVHIVSM